MKIITPVKQVPETGNVTMDEETGTMKRAGVESIMNPLDLYAVESALRLREEHGGEVIAVTMGPLSSEKALREAIAMGCDDGMLLSGREFSGSDTWATAYALSRGIGHIGDYDLIICGERATDGDTGQVGPEIASLLDLPIATYVSSVETVHCAGSEDPRSRAANGYIVVERLLEDGYETLKLSLPALLTVVKEINVPRLPTLAGKKTARDAEISPCSINDIPMDRKLVGLNGSPTRVVSIDRPKVTRNGKVIDARDESRREEAVEELLNCMRRLGVLKR